MSPITLPWPPAALSSNARVHWAKRARATRKYRDDACVCARAAKAEAPATGDIPLTVRFVPPHGRFDRANFPAMAKAGLDGIADHLRVNDRRFEPRYEYAEPGKPGHIIVTLEAV